jgi:hypothetical protein
MRVCDYKSGYSTEATQTGSAARRTMRPTHPERLGKRPLSIAVVADEILHT